AARRKAVPGFRQPAGIVRAGLVAHVAGGRHAHPQGRTRTEKERGRPGRSGRAGRRNMSIVVDGVSKQFGKFKALDQVSLKVPSGELVAVLGPSGSGKTTLLRIIAGLEVPDAGSVRIAEEDITQQAARDRNIGFVFQHYALFRHMTVFDNIAFGLSVRNRPKD